MNFLQWITSLFSKPESGKKVAPKPKEKSMITLDQLLQINGGLNKAECQYYLDALNKILPSYQIVSRLRIAHFLAQVIHESGNLKAKVENLNYGGAGLRATFGKYFTTDAMANQYERQPEKIANLVYANRMGNGDTASGDGWKYRGRGLIQLTGRDNYRNLARDTKIDCEVKPDLIIDNAENSIIAACWFWDKNKLNMLADADDVNQITRKINGGTNGLAHRTEVLNKAKSVLKV